MNAHHSTPVNRTAGLVTSQSGCSDELTPEQIRENLVAKVKKLQEDIKTLTGGEKKKVGLQIHHLQTEINAIRAKQKGDRDLSAYIVDVVKESVPACR